MTDITPMVSVPITSAWSSKINWTQGVAILSSVLVLFLGPNAGLTPDQQAAVVTVITLIQGIVTYIMKTWFTSTVHPSSIKKGN